MSRLRIAAVMSLALVPGLVHTNAAGQSPDRPVAQAVISELNNDEIAVKGSDQAKCYKILFDAYLELGAPPEPISDFFNHATIHPGMETWADVSGWAESNSGMAQALIASASKFMIGLPYGQDEVPSDYREAGLCVIVGDENHRIRFPYVAALDGISAFATAEAYRRLEAGDIQDGYDLMIANIHVLRKFCDRLFYTEKEECIGLLIESLANLRDMFYLYLEEAEGKMFVHIAWDDMAKLRPDPNALLLPEGDRILADEILNAVFDSRGQPIPEKFVNAFTPMEAAETPLMRFGLARRWAMLAQVHGSKDASKERLTDIFDNWWWRWRLRETSPVWDIETQYARTNPIRYAAVLSSVEDINELFVIRKRLIASVNGAAIAAGLCAYYKEHGEFPDDVKKVYNYTVRKRMDEDPYQPSFSEFQYKLLNARQAVDTPNGRLWIPGNQALLYAVGLDEEDGQADAHRDDGESNDMVLWPAIRAMERENGLID